jgi:DNA-binding NarL/FixJ family response regulator
LVAEQQRGRRLPPREQDLEPEAGSCSAGSKLAGSASSRRNAHHKGADSLTPVRRVAELAAAGSTSREIAQTVFVTEKAVETRVGRAFRKLGISSRRLLPEVLARAPGNDQLTIVKRSALGTERCRAALVAVITIV